MNELTQHIATITLCNTHDHIRKEPEYVERGPDVLQDLFANYVPADLIVAGASPAAVKRLTDGNDPDIMGRFAGIQDAWEAVKLTGYGEVVRLIAKHAYNIEDLTPHSVESARERNIQLRQPGERLRILRQQANLDHIQVDRFVWQCLPDESGLDFFLYDLSWVDFCSGVVDPPKIHDEVGIGVTNIRSLDEAMQAIFEKYGACAIAVKAQHAYNRSLFWQERSSEDAERALQARLQHGDKIGEEQRLCLGDWCWARGVELAIEHNLSFKLHTGYCVGHGRMVVDRIRGGHLCPILAKFPKARFVLMHIAYPYSDELVALAKHYPNVWVDLCWAWSIDPYSTSDFVRRMIHTVPSNKLFAFGGDMAWPNAVLGASIQARQWLTYTLQAEVDDGLLRERSAVELATRFMMRNQYDCFDLCGTRSAIRSAAEKANLNSTQNPF